MAAKRVKEAHEGRRQVKKMMRMKDAGGGVMSLTCVPCITQQLLFSCERQKSRWTRRERRTGRARTLKTKASN